MTPRSSRLIAISAACLSLVGCSHGHARSTAPRVVEPGSFIGMVESAPVETTLDHADIPNADKVWVEMMSAAKHTLEVAAFYTSDEPNSRLGPVIAAIREAAARGVHVRFLVDDSFSTKYPDTLLQLTSQKGIELRKLAAQKRMGGILHAKYFVVDRSEAYLGSQNFDWRSLEHIQEMGVRIHSKELAGQLRDVFYTDWELAGGAPDSFRSSRQAVAGATQLASGELVSFVASPKGWLPDEAEWELPQLVKLLDNARKEVSVQLLTYGTKSFDGSRFFVLDEALQRAASRGVHVRLLVSDWSNKPRSWGRHSISALSRVQGIEVRVITIPKWSGGEIPFARVCHSKFLVVDGRWSWVGTGNWEGDYFLKSRNVGVVVDSAPFTERLTKVLDDGWDSAYAKPLEPMGKDEVPAENGKRPQKSEDKHEGDY